MKVKTINKGFNREHKDIVKGMSNGNTKSKRMKTRSSLSVNKRSLGLPTKKKSLSKSPQKQSQIKKEKDIQVTSTPLTTEHNNELPEINNIYSLLESTRNNYYDLEHKLFSNTYFNINPITFQLRSLNSDASSLLTNQTFWIVYIEYLFNTHKLNSSSTLLKIANSAFQHLLNNNDTTLLKQCYITHMKHFDNIEHNNNISTYKKNDDNYYMSLLETKTKMCTSATEVYKKIKKTEAVSHEHEIHMNDLRLFSFSNSKLLDLKNEENNCCQEEQKDDVALKSNNQKVKSNNDSTPVKTNSNVKYSRSGNGKNCENGRNVLKEKRNSENNYNPINTAIESNIRKCNKSFTQRPNNINDENINEVNNIKKVGSNLKSNLKPNNKIKYYITFK